MNSDAGGRARSLAQAGYCMPGQTAIFGGRRPRGPRPPNGAPMKFREDINVLRALAVTAVVLYHYKVNFIPGGFVGVDVFFVISGYLMTAIIAGRLEKGSFSIWAFYCDRARRIIPGL